MGGRALRIRRAEPAAARMGQHRGDPVRAGA